MKSSNIFNENAKVRINNYAYFVYKPKLFKLFQDCYQPMSFRKYIRFSISALRGSRIIYMEVDGETVGYCLLEPGGGRYKNLNKSDLVISPYVIREDLRGKGYGTRILKDVVSLVGEKQIIFAIVKKDNCASLHAMEKAGYIYKTNANIVGLLRKYVFGDDANYEYNVYSSCIVE